jgi:hypothetical protein
MGMQFAAPHPECTFHHEGEYLRAHVGPASAAEIRDCYQALASLVVEHKFERVLVLGLGEQHAHSHLGARDVVVALHQIGVPAGFKVAMVPKSDATLNGFRHAELAARERGMRVQVFREEAQAVRWLTQPELH